MKQRLTKALKSLMDKNNYRTITTYQKHSDSFIYLGKKRYLNFSSNDYLGLSKNPSVISHANQFLTDYGSSSTSSRLVTGNLECYDLVEAELSSFKETECSLIFNSGYTTNLGIITSLVGRGDYIICDRLSHASIIDGSILSRANIIRFRHNDMNDLEKKLKSLSIDSIKLIITEAVFSMDGDIAPLEEIVKLKEKYNAILMVDEAHSTGIFGNSGKGLVCQYNLKDKVEIQMGTFSKALGSAGGYFAGDTTTRKYLINKSRSLIYTTGLPPSVLGATYGAIKYLKENVNAGKKLIQKSEELRNILSENGFNILQSESQIIPIVIGTNENTFWLSHKLEEDGIVCIAITPPTVPENSSRLRLSITLDHSDDDISFFLSRLIKHSKELNII